MSRLPRRCPTAAGSNTFRSLTASRSIVKTAHLAEAFNVSVCPHFLMELHVSLTAAVPNGRWVEYIPQLDSLTLDREDGAPCRSVQRLRLPAFPHGTACLAYRGGAQRPMGRIHSAA